MLIKIMNNKNNFYMKRQKGYIRKVKTKFCGKYWPCNMA
jgi:hypothetical protein